MGTYHKQKLHKGSCKDTQLHLQQEECKLHPPRDAISFPSQHWWGGGDSKSLMHSWWAGGWTGRTSLDNSWNYLIKLQNFEMLKPMTQWDNSQTFSRENIVCVEKYSWPSLDQLSWLEHCPKLVRAMPRLRVRSLVRAHTGIQSMNA